MKEIRKTLKIGKTTIFTLYIWESTRIKKIGIYIFKLEFIHYETK